MAIELIAITKAITDVAEKVLGGVAKFEKSKSEDRTRLANLLDQVADEVIGVGEVMEQREIPDTRRAAIFAYRKQLPTLVSSVYDKSVAEELGVELAAVYDARRLARSILSGGRSNANEMLEIKALTSTVFAAAGTIRASPNILRAI